MSRSFDVSADSTATVDQVHAAFSGEDYWLARLAQLNGNAILESLSVDDDRTVRVVTSQDLGRELLPGLLVKFYRRGITVRHTETWRLRDGDLHGEVSAAVSGAPGAGSGVAVVASIPTGCRMSFTGTVEFKVPLVGGGVENFIAREFTREIPEIQKFTSTWITEHA